MLKELKVGDWSISDIRGIFFFMKQHGGRTFGMYNINPAIMSKYGDRKINPAYYGKIEATKSDKWLTDEEFAAGKAGYFLAPYITVMKVEKIYDFIPKKIKL